MSAQIAICKSHWSVCSWFSSTRFAEIRSKDWIMLVRVNIFFSRVKKRSCLSLDTLRCYSQPCTLRSPGRGGEGFDKMLVSRPHLQKL